MLDRPRPSPSTWMPNPNKRRCTHEVADNVIRATDTLVIERDEYDVFGEYVAHSLRKLKTDHARLVVKHEISTLLFNGGMGCYDEPAGTLPITSSTTLPATSLPTSNMETVLIKLEDSVKN